MSPFAEWKWELASRDLPFERVQRPMATECGPLRGQFGWKGHDTTALDPHPLACLCCRITGVHPTGTASAWALEAPRAANAGWRLIVCHLDRQGWNEAASGRTWPSVVPLGRAMGASNARVAVGRRNFRRSAAVPR